MNSEASAVAFDRVRPVVERRAGTRDADVARLSARCDIDVRRPRSSGLPLGRRRYPLDVRRAVGTRHRSGVRVARERRRQGHPGRRLDDEPSGMDLGVLRHLARRRRGRHAQHILDSRAELEYLLNTSCVAVLLFERKVLKTDFAVRSVRAGARDRQAAPGALQSAQIPVPPPSRNGRRCALRHRHLGRLPCPWSRRATRTCPRDGGGGAPERCGSAVFLVGLHEQAQRHPQRASRCRHPNVALPTECAGSGRTTTSVAGRRTASSGPAIS